jgi:putative ribosome biogenesis GTPase RsgA
MHPTQQCEPQRCSHSTDDHCAVVSWFLNAVYRPHAEHIVFRL